MGTAIATLFFVGFLILVGHAIWQSVAGPKGQTRSVSARKAGGAASPPKPSYSAKKRTPYTREGGSTSARQG